MSDNSKPNPTYSCRLNFPRYEWQIDCEIDSSGIKSLCEELDALVIKKKGITLLTPDKSSGVTLCHYQWPRRWRGSSFGMHLGLHFEVATQPLYSVKGFATTNEIVDAGEGNLPKLSKDFFGRLTKEVLEFLQLAIYRVKNEPTQSFKHLFYIKNPSPFLAFQSQEDLVEDTITLFPSILKDSEYVTPIVIANIAHEQDLAKSYAQETARIYCALASLISMQNVVELNPSWKKAKTAPPTLLDDKSNYSKIYPEDRDFYVSQDIHETSLSKIRNSWDFFYSLDEGDRKMFTQAIFAYQAGIAIRHTYPTLSIVAFVASLSALTEPFRKKCKGSITCTACGDLSFKHDLQGDKAAIMEFTLSIGEIPSDKVTDVKKLLNRVYYKQRSAYVHGAILRHNESSNAPGSTLFFPSGDKPVNEILEYKEDAISMEVLTKRVLLAWLHKQNEENLNASLFGIDLSKVLIRIPNSFHGSGAAKIKM